MIKLLRFFVLIRPISALDALCTQLPRDMFAIAKFLYFGLMKFYKIWMTYSLVYSGHNCS